MIAFIARQIRRLIALVALAAMLIGAPYALYKLGGPLLPDHVPGLAEIWQRLTERDTGQVFLGFLVIVGFVAWAIFAITILMEIVSRIAHRPDWHLPGLHLPQSAAGLLVGMLIAGTIATSATPAIAASMPLLPHPAPVAVVATASPFHAATPAVHHGQAGMTSQPAAPARTMQRAAATGPTWTVSKGDNLWSIAEKTLGNGRRYFEIAALNEGHIQPDGRVLNSARFLLPGWILQLPAGAHIPAGQGGSPAAGPNADGHGVAETVVVEPGDTLSQIALDELGDATLYPEIAAANHIANPDLIYPGQTIHIPAPESAPAISNGSSTPAASWEDGPTGSPAGDVPATTAGHAPAAGDPAPVATAPGAASAEPGMTAQTGDHGTDSSAPQSTTGHSETAPAQPATTRSESSTTPDSPEKVQIGAAGTENPKPPAGDQPASSSRHAALLSGATAMLAAIAWAGLIAARRRLARRRRPGQGPDSLTVEEAQVERVMRECAKAVAPQRLNAALRSISGLLAEHAPSGVDLLLIGGDDIEVRPTYPAPPPRPFTGTEGAWLLNLPDLDEPVDAESTRGEMLSALPALVTLGTLQDGRLVAVDIEHLGALGLTGDPDRCRQLANHIVLELSQSPWTDGVHIALHGVPERADVLDVERVQVVENLEVATQFIRYQVEHTRDLLGDGSIAQARSETAYSDAWEPHIVIADANDLAEIPGINQLIETLERGPSAAAAIISMGDCVDVRMRVTVDRNGALHLPQPADIEGITAASVSDAELAAIISLFGKQNVDAGPIDAQSVIDPPDGAAPEIESEPEETAAREPRREEASAPPRPESQSLDADTAEWFSDNPSRPRIAILGDVHVDGLGVLPDRPIARMTEYAVYLALHPSGVSVDKFVTDLWPENRQPSDSTRRADVSRLRAWLGMRTPDEPFLPTMSGRYQLTDRLVDAELFARLRSRALSHAQHGDAHAALVDYQTALRLVRGPALPEAGGPGYTWLSNADRMEDRILPTQIVDTAHSLVDIALTIGDVTEAEAAAMTARSADPYSSIPLCDMVRIALATDDRETARTWADLMLTLNGVDLPADLPEPCADVVANLYRAQTHSAHTRAAS